MRNSASFVLTFPGALIALTVFFSPPLALAASTFVNFADSPRVTSLALFAGSNTIELDEKTRENVRVVLTIQATSTPINDIPLNQDSYTFTENGTFDFFYHSVDGNSGSTTVTIDNIDRTPPVITIASYSTTPTKDNVEVTASTDEGILNATSTPFTDNGSFDFVATDEAGNISTSTVTISHIDRTPPVISLTGQTVVQLRAGGSFVDEGATASDNMSTAVAVVTTGTVDTGTAGTYTLTYSATDEAGNDAQTVTRTIEVSRRSSSGGGGSRTTTTTSASTGRVLGASTYNFAKDLAVGDKGEDVTALQTALSTEGYFTEAPTGYYGKITEAAVKLYQTANGITASGVCGPLTRAALSGGTVPAPVTVEAQIASLFAQLLMLQQKLAALTR